MCAYCLVKPVVEIQTDNFTFLSNTIHYELFVIYTTFDLPFCQFILDKYVTHLRKMI